MKNSSLPGAPDSELRIVAQHMPAAALRCSRDLRFLWVNPHYARWLGTTPENVAGRSMAELLGPRAMRELQPSIDRVLAGEPVDYERLVDFPGLRQRWVRSIYTPTKDASGAIDGWVAVAIDVHDRHVAEDAVKEADRRKDEFLAVLAHELRNPLAPMRNAVAILGRKGPLDPEVAWSRGVMERQIDQLTRLIDDLLDIERIARGRFELRTERVPLELVVDMALESSRPQINASGHHLSVLLPAERVHVEADPARLAQVFATLLRNAAKHMTQRGSIGLNAVVEGREVAVSVSDDGAGFESLPEAGVGLQLVRGIVALHRGRLEPKSAGRGKGSEFIVRLPAVAGDAARQPRPEYVPDRQVSLRVLVADDNRDAADSLQRILAHFGHEVRVAYDGAAALRVGQEFQPRIAVLDIGMPGTDGYEVARAFRKKLGGEVKLVALTGWGQEADRRRALEAGFDHHLTKPVDPGALNDLLLMVLDPRH
ncbi:MAG TPA: response regulator [Burkholderiales bacterium]|nr:response regulator [Burkholderiales bacterium]